MRCSLHDSLVWLYPDSSMPARPVHLATLDVAQGGIAAFTILLSGLQLEVPLEVTLSPLPSKWELFRLLDVMVEKNTGLSVFCERDGVINPHVVRRAPFRVYDAMEPLPAKSCKVSVPTQALRLHIPIARHARPELCELICTLRQGTDVATLKLRIRIFPVQLPRVGGNTFPYTNWYSVDNIASRHGLQLWSAGHWRMLRQYASLMAKGRQNTFLLPLNHLFSCSAAGELELNRVRLRRWVKTFSEAGLYYIEGGHLGHRTDGKWDAPTFSTVITNKLATTPEGHRDVVRIATQLMDEIDRNRWHDRWVQHIADEPIAANAADYRILTGMVRKYMPGVPIIDATMNEALVGSVDIWCPQVQAYQQNRERFQQMQELGDSVWSYTCCSPGGPWLNRLLDMELLRPTLLGWGSTLFDLDGFLHWGLNQYLQGQDPMEMNVIPNWGGGSNSLPPGDTHIIYPGHDGPWSSVRFEAQREGIEDFELLRLLRARDPKLLATILLPVIRGFDDYTKDAAVLRTARRKILQALSGRETCRS